MKNKIPFVDARYRAGVLIEQLEQYCQRIEIAGSIRRLKPEVGDIELIAIPKPTLDLFSAITEEHQLDNLDYEGMRIGRKIKGGHKYKQIELKGGVILDLFIVTPPAEWGVQFLIRTGPAEFSHKLVMKRRAGGLLPSNLRVKDGAIWSNNHIIPTPEEQDVFELIGIPYIEPKDRR